MNARAPISIVLALALPMGAAGGGYLAMIGPAPVRFKVARPPAELPPLRMSDDPAPATAALQEFGPPATPGMVSAEAEKSGVAPASKTQAFVDEDPSFVGPVLPQVGPAAVEKGVLTPRAFLQYFTPSSTNNGTTVVVPLDFTPPASIPRASSTATYEKK